MYKQILFDDASRAKLLKGIDILAEAVKVTLGPKGRNVVIKQLHNTPIVTKDGVTVAKEIQLKDVFEDMGAQLVKEVASNTSDTAGDGTTTATVLAQAIAHIGLKNVTAGANPMELKRGIDKAVEAMTEELKRMSIPITSKKEISQVATISANNDPDIGEIIAEAMEKVGNDGVITVEEASGIKTYLDVVEGIQFDRGYLSPYFITNQNTQQAIMNNAFILIYDGRINTMKSLIPILEKVNSVKKPLVIIADDVEGEALQTLVLNKLKGAINVVAIKAPSFGDKAKDMLQDIATVTGGNFISEGLGHKLDDITLENLGRAKRIVVDKKQTTIIEGEGKPEAIKARISELRDQVGSANSDYEREHIQERLAKIVGGVAILNIGAVTEVEMKEKKARVEDALHATRAAVEEGIVPGGGVALIRAVSALDELILEGDQKIGADIIRSAIDAPLRCIVKNAGKESSVIINKIIDTEKSFGYNANTDVFEDLIEAGVIDPVKVTRTALLNASSISGLVLTTECVIADVPDDSTPPPPMDAVMSPSLRGMA